MADVTFGFRPLEVPKDAKSHTPSLDAFEQQQRLMQWGLEQPLKVTKLQFVRAFKRGLADEFMQELFSCDAVREFLGAAGNHVESVDYEDRRCSVKNLEFFDRIAAEPQIVAPSGHIRRCMDEDVDGKVLSDEVQKVLIDPSSEHYDLYGEDERGEVIFRLLRLLCGGGAMAQTSESFPDYLDTLRKLYRDVVSVAKDRATAEIKVTTVAFEVKGLAGSVELFPAGAQPTHSLCLALVDPLRKHVTLLHMAHAPIW